MMPENLSFEGSENAENTEVSVMVNALEKQRTEQERIARRSGEYQEAHFALTHYGQDVLSRRQKIILGVQPAVDVHPELDDRQQEISAWFQVARTKADELSEDAYYESLHLRLVEKTCEIYAKISSEIMQDLEQILAKIGDAIPMMSAQAPITAEQSFKYVEQEILREELKNRLYAWHALYKGLQDEIALSEEKESRDTSEGEELCRMSIDVLCTSLSDLSNEDEIRRASFILGEIQHKRVQLWRSFTTAPVRICKMSAVTIPAAVAAVEHIFAAGIGIVATTGTQYVYTGVKNVWEGSRYNIAESSVKAFLREQYERNRASVIHGLIEAGVTKNPEEALGMKVQ